MSSIAQAAGSAAATAALKPGIAQLETGALSVPRAEGATASAAASVSVGLRRLPPANTLYRMASLMTGGHAGGRGK